MQFKHENQVWLAKFPAGAHVELPLYKLYYSAEILITIHPFLRYFAPGKPISATAFTKPMSAKLAVVARKIACNICVDLEF
jgi:hypothetical protein